MKFKNMIYNRLDYEEIEIQAEELMRRSKEANNQEEVFEIHQEWYQLMNEVESMLTICHIRHDIDTKDKFYSEEQDFNDSIRPKLENLNQKYYKGLFDSKFRPYMEEKIGKVAFKNIEISLKAFDECLIPLMQEENVLTSKYDKLLASAEIDWEGEILNISLLRPYLTNKDRDIRQKAWDKLTSFFDSIADELDDIYDALVQNRTKQATKMGYKNYVELGYYRMNRNCYDKYDVENFRKQIKEDFVPFAEKLHERRRKRLGLKKLSFIDEGVCFLKGNPQPIGTPEEILLNGQIMYSELSNETKEFFDFMTENELFDVLGRKTKKAGGYMTYIPKYQSPFIFANFNGTSGDVDVITHECGHAFQGYLSGKDPIREHADITMETAEIHSMAMEFFTEPWMEKFFGDRTKDYLEMHLEDSAAFIPYGCMVDEFQHIVYENPTMTKMDRHETWKQLEKEYKPHLDYGNNSFFGKGAFWQKQLHIYDYPFYYIDYCLAQTCAFQYKVMMDEDYKEAWNSYLKLCKLSASDFYINMLPEVGLQVPFEEGTLKNMVKKLEKIIK